MKLYPNLTGFLSINKNKDKKKMMILLGPENLWINWFWTGI